MNLIPVVEFAPTSYQKKHDEERLRLRKTSEYSEPEEPVVLELKRSDLKLAVADAEEKLFNFQQGLLPILRKLMRNKAQGTLQVLINGY